MYFAQTYVKIQDRVKKATIDFESWPHIIYLLQLLAEGQDIIIGKARQVAASWTIGGIFATHKAVFFENVKGLFFSQGEKEAIDLLAKPKFIHDNLPDWMRGAPRSPDSATNIKFPTSKSELVALPSTEKAGRSTDATFVITDEAEYHEYAEQNFAAIRPTISAGGQHIILSTANPLVTPDASWFKRMYNAAPENGYIRLFLPWGVRPDRNAAWLARETRAMPAWQAAGEYPTTEEDMLQTLRTMPYFDMDVLESWENNTLNHIPFLGHKTVKVWKPPIVGRKYVVYTDPSDGKTDPHVTAGRNSSYSCPKWTLRALPCSPNAADRAWPMLLCRSKTAALRLPRVSGWRTHPARTHAKLLSKEPTKQCIRRNRPDETAS